MITTERIQALTRLAEAEGIQGDIQSVLKNALTVGELVEVLKGLDPSLPIELEIPVEIEGLETMVSEVAYLVTAFENAGDGQDTAVLTLQGCKPDLYDAFRAWHEADQVEAQ